MAASPTEGHGHAGDQKWHQATDEQANKDVWIADVQAGTRRRG
jgi:cytochrome c556